MKTNERQKVAGLLMAAAILSAAGAAGVGGSAGCGSTTSATSGGTTPAGSGTTVNGTLTQPNGDPLPGALVYAETSTGSSTLILKSKKNLTDNEGHTCEDVPSGVNAAASDCTGGDGSFSLDLIDCSKLSLASGQLTLHFRLGALVGSFQTAVNCSESAIESGNNSVGGAAVEKLRIAVCSGEYDKMENVLARMGFAPSDTDGDGDQDFNGYDGSQTENFNYFRGHNGVDSDYPSCCELLKGSTVAVTDRQGNPVMDAAGNPLRRSLADYDIAFLNCGSGCESGGFTPVIDDIFSRNPSCGIPSGTGSLNTDDTVNVCDFLGAWAVMIGMEATNSATTWIRGAAEFSGGPDTDVSGNAVSSGDKIPLTVTYTQGDGVVLYSSYHTDNSPVLTPEFLPQERVLQFLVLELVGAL